MQTEGILESRQNFSLYTDHPHQESGCRPREEREDLSVKSESESETESKNG